jgi:hypothetical protein
VLRDLDQRRITAAQAARLMHLTRRQVFRLVKAFRACGLEALVSAGAGVHVTRSRQTGEGRA